MATASALRQLDPDLQLLYGGRCGGLEDRIAAAHGIAFVPLAGRPLSGDRGVGRAVLALVKGLHQARGLLRREQPDVVIGTGGYASTALAMAQALRNKPLVLVEGNAMAGRTNRLLGKKATAVCTAFESCAGDFPAGRCELTGFPVRQEFTQTIDRRTARAAFGLDADRFTLMVVGGSQGAQYFNEIVEQCGVELLGQGIQILHQMGPKNFDSDGEEISGWKKLPMIEDMPSAYGASDVVMARAGCSTFSEMAVHGVAAVLVPYPFSQGGHQDVNATILAKDNRAIRIPQSELAPDGLHKTLTNLRENVALRESLASNLSQWAKPNAARHVAEIALRVAQ